MGGGGAMAYQSYWEQISRFDRMTFFLFSVFSVGGAISAFGTALLSIADIKGEAMIWNWNIIVAVAFLFSVSVCLAYVFCLVLKSRDPAYWARRAVIPIALIALPFGMVLSHLLLEDMKPRPSVSRCTADC
jgi:hypothetical protein